MMRSRQAHGHAHTWAALPAVRPSPLAPRVTACGDPAAPPVLAGAWDDQAQEAGGGGSLQDVETDTLPTTAIASL